MFAAWTDELSGRGVGVLMGLVAGTLITAVVARWRRLKDRRRLLRGDARDTVVLTHHLVERHPDGSPAVLRMRALGQAQADRVVPNCYLQAVLLGRAHAVTAADTLISMTGAEGSYLLEAVTNFVCDRTAGGPFDHDLYVMAPSCEPAGLAEHQPITVLLVAVADLALFADWTRCRGVRVEHGGDGARVLTLHELAKRHAAEQAEMARLRAAGKRTLHVETMYTLDLALDKRTAAVPTKPVPWGRFEGVLKTLGLEAGG